MKEEENEFKLFFSHILTERSMHQQQQHYENYTTRETRGK